MQGDETMRQSEGGRVWIEMNGTPCCLFGEWIRAQSQNQSELIHVLAKLGSCELSVLTANEKTLFARQLAIVTWACHSVRVTAIQDAKVCL